MTDCAIAVPNVTTSLITATDTVVHELRRLDGRTAGPPTLSDVSESRISLPAFYEQFKSFAAALRAARIDPRPQQAARHDA